MKTLPIQILTGKDLKKLRKSYGLTQKEVAKKAGVSQSLIARIEAEKVDPRVSTLKKILNSILSVKAEKNAGDVMHSPVIWVETKTLVKDAVNLMEKYGISQLPVLENEKIVGSIQEGTIIKKILESKEPKKIFSLKVEDLMEEPFPTVSLNTSFDEVLALFTHEKPAVLVVDKGKLVGIIAKIDIITSVGTK